jgi:hypothetical protein
MWLWGVPSIIKKVLQFVAGDYVDIGRPTRIE